MEKFDRSFTKNCCSFSEVGNNVGAIPTWARLEVYHRHVNCKTMIGSAERSESVRIDIDVS